MTGFTAESGGRDERWGTSLAGGVGTRASVFTPSLQSYLLLLVVVLNGEDSVWQSHDRLEIGLKIKAADGVVFDPWFVLRLC
jgi:hypothetical protein